MLGDNAELGTDRTATPLELDEIYGSLNDLTVALGPDGANKATAAAWPLTRLLDSTARNFGGQGVQFHQTIKNLGEFTTTLDRQQGRAVRHASARSSTSSNTLAKNDGTVRQFNDSLACGADLLADERHDLRGGR